MRADSSGPATEAPSVPSFTLGGIGERLGDVLGRGTTSVVYSLRGYPNLAVKEIFLNDLCESSVNAIRLELATVPGLAHLGIVKYHQVIWGRDLVYIVMDRHDKTLERLIIEYKRKRIPVPIELVISAMKQIAAALAYLHSVSGVDAAGAPFRGLVHRDLKPANVLISADGEHFVIADFGLCKNALRNGRTITHIPAYMASETLLRNETSPASDVWGLGVIIYELVVLKRPNFLEGREPRDVFIDGWKPDLSDVTDSFIRRILEKIFVLDPTKRPTARELGGMLAAADIPVNELGRRYVALEGKCDSLETALNSANARIDALETAISSRSAGVPSQSTGIASLKEDLEAKAARIDTLEQELAAKSARIDALEHQGKEYVAMIKALENKFAQFSSGMNAVSPQADLSLLKLIRAARTNDVEAVRMLLEEGVGVDQRDEQGMTALMHAARQGHIGSIKLLVKKEKGLQDKTGWTALMHAVRCNRSEAANILAPHEHGKRDNNNRTALMIAAADDCADCVKLLLEKEGGMKKSDGGTALMEAARNGHPKCVELLLEKEGGMKNSYGWTALMSAARGGHVDCARLLLAKEGGMQKSDGQTALMSAAFNNKIECVRLLVEKEKHIRGTYRIGGSTYTGTALDIATKKGNKEIIAILSAP